MTVLPASQILMNQTPKQPLFIACLVTDKKYRKMGGDDGLKTAIKKAGKDNIFIGQIQVEELVHNSLGFEVNLKNLISKILKKNLKDSENINLLDQNIIIIHKYSDFYKLPLKVDHVDLLRSWLREMTSITKVIDDPDKIDILTDRVRTGNLVRNLCISGGFASRGLQWPEFTESSNYESLNLPIIVKPVDACATDESHWMTLIPETVDGNNEIFVTSFQTKSLVQKFYEHYEVLYKVYVIGSEVIEIVARPSISAKNLSNSVFRFNTHKFKTSEGDLNPSRHSQAMNRLEGHLELIRNFAHKLKNELNLTWFGIDMIIPENSDIKIAVIDVNYMPGYDGINGLPDKIINAILE